MYSTIATVNERYAVRRGGETKITMSPLTKSISILRFDVYIQNCILLKIS